MDQQSIKELEKIRKRLRKSLDDKSVKHTIHDKEQDSEIEIEQEHERITPEAALKLKTELKNKFNSAKQNQFIQEELLKNQYKPVTAALSKVESAIEKVERNDNNIKNLIDNIPNNILSSTNIQILDESSEREENKSLLDVQSREKSPNRNSYLKRDLIGETAVEYLAYAFDKRYNDTRGFDSVFGIYYDNKNNTFKYGKERVIITPDSNIIMNNIEYPGTSGLWALSTFKTSPPKDMYTGNDLKAYLKLLLNSNAIYQNNDDTTNRVKSSSSQKYKEIIKPLWQYMKDTKTDKNTIDLNTFIIDFMRDKTGQGLVKYTENPVEYKYIDNISQIINRLNLIAAEERAGNNNFHNEKLGILHFFTNQLESSLDLPNGTTYLIDFISNFSNKCGEYIDKEGSGIFNKVLNNLPFEMHVPGYNYLGPGTKLDERLAKGDKPINKLDEAAMHHDIYYKHHKKTKDRHKADKVLQKKAWERAVSEDADVNERLVGAGTSGVMYLKRKLGMGLKF